MITEKEIGNGIVAVHTVRLGLGSPAEVRLFDKYTPDSRYPHWGKMLGGFYFDKRNRVYGKWGVMLNEAVYEHVREMFKGVSNDYQPDRNGHVIQDGHRKMYDRRMVKSWRRELRSAENELRMAMEDVNQLAWEYEQTTKMERKLDICKRMKITLERKWDEFGAWEANVQSLRNRLSEEYLTA